MSTGKLTWDATGERYYQTGCSHGVLYKQVGGAYPAGVVWNGLTSVTESPEGADATDVYADDIKYLSLRSAENYKATIEALYSPEEFDECDGSAQLCAGVKISQQPRKAFGFSWQTLKGNDTDFNDHGKIIHVIYGATAAPSEKQHQTVNDSPEAMNLSWELDTIPVNVTGHKPTAHLTIDCTLLNAAQLEAVEDALYGCDAAEAVAATYKAANSGGATYQATGVDYYTKSGDVYTKVQSPSSENFSTYYVVNTPAKAAKTAAAAYLPLPDALATLIVNAA